MKSLATTDRKTRNNSSSSQERQLKRTNSTKLIDKVRKKKWIPSF